MPGGSEILLLAAQVDRPVAALALARPHFHALVAAAFAGSHFARQVLQVRRFLAGLVHVAVVIGGTGAERSQANGGEGGAKQGLQGHGEVSGGAGLAMEFKSVTRARTIRPTALVIL
ncbi:hypothetical protein H2198_009786 [Neophaeococcomyces mojaviensis]|uniref:Uncharacterized protein n=1 Tax=Neophaeococcomyces mojaviensis TaxID=3383035 RepID=A0ACC2ZTI4_9EURO|nr:hypothetical protein H2198_009786 [Knufia sp. JES_112]